MRFLRYIRRTHAEMTRGRRLQAICCCDDFRCPHDITMATLETGDVWRYSICSCPCGDVYVIPMSARSGFRSDWGQIDQEKVSQYMEEEEMLGEECEYCAIVIAPEDETFRVRIDGYDTYTWCESCADSHATSCDVCDVRTADGFGRTVYRGVRDDTWCCESCLGDINTLDCHQCGQFTDADDPCCDTEDDCECEDCIGRNSVVHGYSYMPTLKFKGSDPNVYRLNRYRERIDAGLYMGIELEVEVQSGKNWRATAAKVQAALGDHVYLKTDGSLNNGLEIVSHPATLAWWLSEFRWQGIREIRKDLVETQSTCGLHIHVSRNGFSSAAHEHRWLLFWYRNQRIVEKLARRTSTYAPFNTHDRRQFKINATTGQNGSGHYAAINTGNDATYEVRVFEGTLYVNRLKAAMGLVTATVEYTRQLKASKIMADGGMRWAEFMVWLRANRRAYPCLIEEIEKTVDPAAIRQQSIRVEWQEPNPRAYDDYYQSRWINRSYDAPIQEAYFAPTKEMV